MSESECLRPKPFLRFGCVVQWLAGYGITEKECRRMVESGVIKKCPALRGGGSRPYYSRDQIKRDVIEKLAGV